MELSCTAEYDTLMPAKQKNFRDIIEQEYLVYLFINNSNQKLHKQMKKDVANNYSKWNMEVFPSDIHKAPTLMNEYKQLKLDVIRSAKQDDIYGAPSIVLPCPSSKVIFHLVKVVVIILKSFL